MISNELKTQITQKLNQETGVNNWVIDESKIEARECNVYKASSVNHPHAIAIKIYHEIKNNNSLLQHNVLKRFANTLNTQNNEYFVPKVFGSFPESGVFLMEWIESPPLEKRLWRYFYSKKHVQSDISRSFRWLKAFHLDAGLESKTVDVDRYINNLKQSIKDHEGNTLLSSNVVFQQGKHCFDFCIEHYRDFVTPHAQHHGDFTPSNLLIDDNKVTAIDISGHQHLPIDNDIALQFSYIAIEYINMLTRYDFKLAPKEWPLLKVILDAYEYPETNENPEQLKFFLTVFLYQLLRRWIVINDRNKIKPSTWLDRWRLRNTEMIVKHLSRILKELHTQT